MGVAYVAEREKFSGVIELGINVSNEETLAAIAEAEEISRDPNTKRYAHFSELWEEVLSGA